MRKRLAFTDVGGEVGGVEFGRGCRCGKIIRVLSTEMLGGVVLGLGGAWLDCKVCGTIGMDGIRGSSIGMG